MTIEYLVFNLFIFFSSTFAVYLYPQAKYPHIKHSIIAILSLATPFILVDMVVTNWFWYFNPSYILGWKLVNVPIEEVLFFFTVPWACLLLWVQMKTRFTSISNLYWLGWMLRLLMIFFAVWGVWSHAWYTSTVSIILFVLTSVFHWKAVSHSYMVFAGLVIVLTLIFNSYLTARPVVLYNPEVMTNIRVGTVPIEDFIYGIILVLGVVIVYEKLEHKKDVVVKTL